MKALYWLLLPLAAIAAYVLYKRSKAAEGIHPATADAGAQAKAVQVAPQATNAPPSTKKLDKLFGGTPKAQLVTPTGTSTFAAGGRKPTYADIFANAAIAAVNVAKG